MATKVEAHSYSRWRVILLCLSRRGCLSDKNGSCTNKKGEARSMGIHEDSLLTAELLIIVWLKSKNSLLISMVTSTPTKQ